MEQLKFICTADLHLGHFGPLLQAPVEVQQARVEDGLSCFEKITNHAQHEQADFLIICGDVFHTLRPSGYVFNRFARIVGGLGAQGVQTLVVAGNHDMPRVSGVEPYLSALGEVKAPGFHFFKEPGTIMLQSKRSGRSVRFIFLPYLHLIEAKDEEYIRHIKQTVAKLLSKGRGDYTVILAHLVTEGSSLGVLKELVPYSEPVVPKTVLLQKGVDLVLLGHLHGSQVMADKIIYPGSPERVSFSEEGSTKGFIEVYEEEGKLSHRFIQVPARPLVTYPGKDFFDLSLSSKPTDDLLRILEEEKIPPGAIVRLVFKLGHRQRLDWDKVAELVVKRGALYVLPEQVREKLGIAEIRGAVPSLELLLKEFVDQVLRGKLPPPVMRLVKREGSKIIKEVTEAQ